MLEAPPQLAQRIRHRLRPASIFARHAARARAAGLRDLRLVLSFDCDTPEDAEAAPEVHRRCLELGVLPVYAVPGELLRRGADTYLALAADGAEFLNHGGREHAYFDRDQNRYGSCFFYDQVGDEAVREDVAAGDRIAREVLGAPPSGFRTPHFGTYQGASQLRGLHRQLDALGYSFSTSTAPLYGLRYGPVIRRFGLPELPLTGTASAPLEILDTWSCFAAPDRVRSADEFRREAEALAAAHAAAGPGLMNVYGDPSHVRGRDEFFDAVAALRAVARPSGYRELVDELR